MRCIPHCHTPFICAHKNAHMATAERDDEEVERENGAYLTSPAAGVFEWSSTDRLTALQEGRKEIDVRGGVSLCQI